MINYRVQIDGVDKTGKDLILKYVTILSNHKYVIQARGLISQLAYSEIYKRQYEYDLNSFSNDIYILLTAEVEDLSIRHKLVNEPKIDIKNDVQIFEKVYNILKSKNFKIFKINTSKVTPYMAAKEIIEIVEELSNV